MPRACTSPISSSSWRSAAVQTQVEGSCRSRSISARSPAGSGPRCTSTWQGRRVVLVVRGRVEYRVEVERVDAQIPHLVGQALQDAGGVAAVAAIRQRGAKGGAAALPGLQRIPVARPGWTRRGSLAGSRWRSAPAGSGTRPRGGSAQAGAKSGAGGLRHRQNRFSSTSTRLGVALHLEARQEAAAQQHHVHHRRHDGGVDVVTVTSPTRTSRSETRCATTWPLAVWCMEHPLALAEIQADAARRSASMRDVGGAGVHHERTARLLITPLLTKWPPGPAASVMVDAAAGRAACAHVDLRAAEHERLALAAELDHGLAAADAPPSRPTPWRRLPPCAARRRSPARPCRPSAAHRDVLRRRQHWQQAEHGECRAAAHAHRAGS